MITFFLIVVRFVFFFFFKQKTAYEMRISDWSSDVCSSDLLDGGDRNLGADRAHFRFDLAGQPLERIEDRAHVLARQQPHFPTEAALAGHDVLLGAALDQIGRKAGIRRRERSEGHTAELQSLMRIPYAVF